MKNLKRNVTALCSALALAAASVSQATPMLRITDGITTVLVADNSASDSSAAAGFINYQAPAGLFAGWSIIVSSGTTKPIIGTATAPELDLNWSITRNANAGVGTLTVCFSENGFNLTGLAQAVNSSGGTLGTGANTALIRTYYDTANVELAATSLMTTHNFSGPGAFAANDANNSVPADPNVAFTIKLDLVQGAGQITSGDIHLRLSVPEGGSMVTFLGTALLALGVFAARRKVQA